jgi:hypothetical protein
MGGVPVVAFLRGPTNATVAMMLMILACTLIDVVDRLEIIVIVINILQIVLACTIRQLIDYIVASRHVQQATLFHANLASIAATLNHAIGR